MVEKPASGERQRLIHDLEAHQAELQAHNHQLREAQALLEESRARYAQLYDLAPVAYCTFDRSGVLLELNSTAARLFGGDRQQLLGKPLLVCATLDDQRRLGEHVAHCCRLRQSCQTEIGLTVTGRPRVVVQIDSVPAFDATGAASGCRSTLTDITERKTVEEALRAALRVRENFLAAVSHDLRNPLNTIFMATELLMGTQPAVERRTVGRRQCRAILTAAERMRRLVSDLLDLSSMEAGHLSVRREHNELRELLRTATDLVLPLAQEEEKTAREVRRGRRAAAGRLRWRAHHSSGEQSPRQRGQGYPRGGDIVVQARRLADRARFTIRNSGPGVSAESRAHIFHADWQANRGGMGKALGLSIAQGLVELHDGKIWLQEAGPAEGDSFVVELPLAACA